MSSNWGQALPILSQATNIVARIYTVLMTFVVIVPFYPKFPHAELDPSWSLGLNEAVSKGLQFGSDIIFTFGPYSSITTKYYHPDTYALIFFTSVLLAAIYSYFAYQSLKESTVAMAIYSILVPTISHYSMDAMFLCFPLLYMTHLINGKDDALKISLYCIFSGIIILVKGSYLILFSLIFMLIILINFYNKKYKKIIYYLFITTLTSFLFWVFSKQEVYYYFNYLYGIFIITDGYSESMSYYGSFLNILLYFTCSIIIVLFVINNIKSINIYLLSIAYISTLFLLFKAGFVRQDDHVRIASGGLILLSLYSLVSINKYYYLQLVVVLILSLVMLGNVFNKYQNSILYNFTKSFKDIQSAYSNYLSGYEEYDTINLQNLEVVRTSTRLPKVSGSSDLYNHDLALLIATDNDWQPRPVFQSYSAYTKRLSHINLNHLITRPPDNIFIKVKTIDDRFPTLDDGASWPIFLSSYAPDSMYGSYLHLLKKPKVSLPDYDIISRTSHALNDIVTIPSSPEIIFSRIIIKKTFIGGFKNLAYKPDILFLTVYFDDGSNKRFRFIASMGESPFLLSPLVEDTDDFQNMFIDPLRNKQVKFIKLQNNGLGTDWQTEYELELIKYDLN